MGNAPLENENLNILLGISLSYSIFSQLDVENQSNREQL